MKPKIFSGRRNLFQKQNDNQKVHRGFFDCRFDID